MSTLTARIYDKNINELPKDLYISPEALQIFLEMFEGPLDLLLYLIRKQNLDILNIPIAQITTQYVTYIEAMKTINIDLVAEYLAMAATLIAIKSRMMLPQINNDDLEINSETDPRNELITRLIEYEQIKTASLQLDSLPIENRDFKWSNIEVVAGNILPKIFTDELQEAWQRLLTRSLTSNKLHHLEKQELSIREYMANILRNLSNKQPHTFTDLLNGNFNLSVMVVNFIAILELSKEGLVKLEPQKNDIMVTLVYTTKQIEQAGNSATLYTDST